MNINEQIDSINENQIFTSYLDNTIYNSNRIKKVMLEFKFTVQEAIDFLDYDRKDFELHGGSLYPN